MLPTALVQQIETAFVHFDQLYAQYIDPLNQVWAPANNLFDHVAETVFDNTVKSDQLKLLVCFLGTIPLGLILCSIKTPILRHIYSCLMGLLLSYFVYGGNVITSHIMTIVVYLLCLVFRRHAQKAVFAFALTYLSLHHIYRQITDYGGWRVDVSVILMMNFCKLTSFAFCYSDGFKKDAQLSKDQQQRKLSQLPNFFSFFSYINFIGSAVAGPTFDYYEFDNFINLKNGYKNHPHPILDTLKNLGIGFIYLAITAVVLPMFPMDYLTSEQYGQTDFYKKIFYYNAAIILIRVRYYTGWLMIQASCSSTGITYNERSKKFDQIITVEESLEFSHEVKVIVDKWNKTIQVWLKRYVYFRLYSEEEIKKSKNKAAYAQYATILISAFWHGFYPGYYLAFLQWAVLISVCKCFYKASCNRKSIFVFLEKFGILYKLLRWVVNASIFNSFGVGFVMLSVENTWKFSKNINFYTLTLVLAAFFFFTITNWGQRTPKTADNKVPSGEKVKQTNSDNKKNN